MQKFQRGNIILIQYLVDRVKIISSPTWKIDLGDCPFDKQPVPRAGFCLPDCVVLADVLGDGQIGPQNWRVCQNKIAPGIGVKRDHADVSLITCVFATYFQVKPKIDFPCLSRSAPTLTNMLVSKTVSQTSRS